MRKGITRQKTDAASSKHGNPFFLVNSEKNKHPIAALYKFWFGNYKKLLRF